MKKMFLFAACLAVLACSCSENEGKHSINSPFHSKNVILLL